MSFIQFMPAMALLQSRELPAIPFQFLLRDGPFKEEFSKAKASRSLLRPPWREGYGKMFWALYLPDDLRSNDGIWRAQIPFEYDFTQHVTSLSLTNCNVAVRTYLYPWGLGLIVDVGFRGPMPLFEAVDRAFEIQSKAKLEWQFDTKSDIASLPGFMDAVFERLRAAVYAGKAAKEQASELFSVVTVTDATGTSSTDPVDQGDPVHRALEAMAGWNPLWKKMSLKPLSAGKIAIRQSPEGHMIYGKQQGRVVWFPENFPSAGAKPTTLACFHQNLSAASLHVASLCRIIEDVAAQLSNKKTLAPFSATYRDCAKLTAGVLGRLHGKKNDDDIGKKPETYRSGSIRTQVQLSKNDINTVRTEFKMSPLDT